MSDFSAREGTVLLDRARAIVSPYRFVADQIDTLCTTEGSEYTDRAEGHLQRLHRALEDDDARFDDAVEAFVEMTVDVIRMQARYYRTGQFDAAPEELGDGVIYEDDDLMGRRYLCGLYLAQVFWPNHLEKVRYFEHEFLPIATENARVLEIGTGPGTYGLAIGRSVECSELTLTDISPLSLDTARRIASVDPVRRPETLHFAQTDFLDFDVAANEQFDIVLFSEVIEHLRDPALGLDIVHECLAPGGSVFFSTVTHAAFYDHTIVFQNIDEIELLLEQHGFEVLSCRTILAIEGPEGQDVLDYVAVLRAAK